MEDTKNLPLERKYPCPWPGCVKTFMRKTDVTRHERIHSNIRPFKCEWPGCEKAFMQRSAVKIHFRTHTGEKPNRCPFEGCGKAFNDTSSLARHRRTHHYDTPFPCSFRPCQERFPTRKLLIEHEKVAHGEKRLSVDISPREFHVNSFCQQITPDSSSPKELNSLYAMMSQPSASLDFGKASAFVNYKDKDQPVYVSSRNEDRCANISECDGFHNQNDDPFPNSSDRFANQQQFHPKSHELDYSRSLQMASPESPQGRRFDQRSMSISHFTLSELNQQMSFLQRQGPLSANDSYGNLNLMMEKQTFKLSIDTMRGDKDHHPHSILDRDNSGPTSPYFLDSSVCHDPFSEIMSLPTPNNSANSVNSFGQHFQFPSISEELHGGKPIVGEICANTDRKKIEHDHNRAQSIASTNRHEDARNGRRGKFVKPPPINTSVSSATFQFIDYSLKSATEIEDRTENTPLLSPIYPPRTADALTHYFSRFSTIG